MRPECLPRLKQSLQSRKNPRPTIRVLSIRRIVLRPLIVRYHNLHRLRLRSQLHLHSRHHRPIAHAELVLEQLRRLHPQHLSRHIPHRLPILTRPRPGHRPARLQVQFKVRADEDFLIRLLRNEPIPDLLDGGGNVIRKNQWCLRHITPRPRQSSQITQRLPQSLTNIDSFTLRAERNMYYTARDGQDLSPVRARAGCAAPAEPARVVPEDHLEYFVSDLVDQLDLSAITTVYEEEDRAYPPYHPVMLTKVLVYAYCVGVFSSRKIQRRLIEDVPFRVLAAGNEPDFRTIADFRKRHLTALQGFFEQVRQVARDLGTLRMGRIALDGTKVKANASKHKAMSFGRMKDKTRQLRDEVTALLAQAEATDAAEDAAYGADVRGDELPAELQRRESRLQRIREATHALK